MKNKIESMLAEAAISSPNQGRLGGVSNFDNKYKIKPIPTPSLIREGLGIDLQSLQVDTPPNLP